MPMTNSGSQVMSGLVWNVIYHSVNGNEIKTFNIFDHYSFREELKKLYKKCFEKEDFARELRRSLMYYFWSKCEWEIIIGPWCGSKRTKEIKVDVYWQIMNNWERFLDYVWSAKTSKTGCRHLNSLPKWSIENTINESAKVEMAQRIVCDFLRDEDKPRIEVAYALVEHGIPEYFISKWAHRWPVRQFLREGQCYWHLELRGYSESYLNDVVENQGKLFDYVAHQFPFMNTEAFIIDYMNSKTRKNIDDCQVYVNTKNAKDLWEYFTSTEKYQLKPGIISDDPAIVAHPSYISKTVNVALQPPFTLMVAFENGEKRALDIGEYINNDPKYQVLKNRPELLHSPAVSMCGYQTVWEDKGLYLEFHNDIVFVNGRDIKGPLDGFMPQWIGEFYAYYQWRYNMPSSEVIKRVPLRELKKVYWGLRDYPIDQAVEKVGNTLLLKEKEN